MQPIQGLNQFKKLQYERLNNNKQSATKTNQPNPNTDSGKPDNEDPEQRSTVKSQNTESRQENVSSKEIRIEQELTVMINVEKLLKRIDDILFQAYIKNMVETELGMMTIIENIFFRSYVCFNTNLILRNR